MFFGGERVDRRRPDRRHRQAGRLRHVLAPVEDGRVVARDRRQQEVEHLLVRRREVDVAAPDPARVGAGEVVAHRRRLRVVDDDEVVFAFELRARSARCTRRKISCCSSLRPCGLPWSALWIVFVTSKNSSAPWMIRHSVSSPASHMSGIERVVDLGDAAAERSRGEVQDPLARERLGEAADLVHQPARRQRRVVAERLVADVDLLEHGAPLSRGSEVLDEAEPRAAALPAARSRARRRASG